MNCYEEPKTDFVKAMAWKKTQTVRRLRLHSVWWFWHNLFEGATKTLYANVILWLESGNISKILSPHKAIFHAVTKSCILFRRLKNLISRQLNHFAWQIEQNYKHSAGFRNILIFFTGINRKLSILQYFLDVMLSYNHLFLKILKIEESILLNVCCVFQLENSGSANTFTFDPVTSNKFLWQPFPFRCIGDGKVIDHEDVRKQVMFVFEEYKMFRWGEMEQTLFKNGLTTFRGLSSAMICDVQRSIMFWAEKNSFGIYGRLEFHTNIVASNVGYNHIAFSIRDVFQLKNKFTALPGHEQTAFVIECCVFSTIPQTCGFELSGTIIQLPTLLRSNLKNTRANLSCKLISRKTLLRDIVKARKNQQFLAMAEINAAPYSDQKKYFLIGGENVCVGILRRVRGLKKFSHKSVNYKDFGPKTTTLESGLLFSQPGGYKNCIESNGIHRFYSKNWLLSVKQSSTDLLNLNENNNWANNKSDNKPAPLNAFSSWHFWTLSPYYDSSATVSGLHSCILTSCKALNYLLLHKKYPSGLMQLCLDVPTGWLKITAKLVLLQKLSLINISGNLPDFSARNKINQHFWYLMAVSNYSKLINRHVSDRLNSSHEFNLIIRRAFKATRIASFGEY
ncbi:hypothetical protein HUJ05_013066 [Dendroctonus ponderosae]|nr:hypothetical protein HUJ05_013066 [Dendroctonus ponderosae]